MAELIDKDELIQIIDTASDDLSERLKAVFIDIVAELPTTTEAEIRAKAISDFLQFVYDNASNEEYANEDGWAMSDLIDLEYKFLEQLKEEQ